LRQNLIEKGDREEIIRTQKPSNLIKPSKEEQIGQTESGMQSWGAERPMGRLKGTGPSVTKGGSAKQKVKGKN